MIAEPLMRFFKLAVEKISNSWILSIVDFLRAFFAFWIARQKRQTKTLPMDEESEIEITVRIYKGKRKGLKEPKAKRRKVNKKAPRIPIDSSTKPDSKQLNP